MPEEIAEASELAEQHNKKLINLLGGIALTLAVLMILLVLAALGFLLYGLVATRLDVSISGVVVCVIGFILLFELFRLVVKIIRRQAPGQENRLTAAVATGSQTYAKVKEELHTRYQSEQQEKRSKNLELYARVKEDLNRRYKRAKNGEY